MSNEMIPQTDAIDNQFSEIQGQNNANEPFPEGNNDVANGEPNDVHNDANDVDQSSKDEESSCDKTDAYKLAY